jgi:hypothetical protein
VPKKKRTPIKNTPIPKGERRVVLTLYTATVLLDITVTKARWYISRRIEIPEHVWGVFAILCYDLKIDPHEIIKREIRSSKQVFRV